MRPEERAILNRYNLDPHYYTFEGGKPIPLTPPHCPQGHPHTPGTRCVAFDGAAHYRPSMIE